jgi:hypothetical protein
MNRCARLASFALGLAAARGVFADEASERPAIDLAYKARAVAESHSRRSDSVFAPGLDLTSFGRDRGRLEGEARGRAGPLSLLVTATYAGQQREEPDSKLLANEAYIDFGSGGNRFTVGKKILSGDVGYGFRPIDVIQREQRLQVLPPALEGVPHLAWERYTADTAWSVVLANPGHGERGDAKHDGSLALRGYRRADGADLHGVARFSERYRVEAGGAVSAVPLESLELHASFLVQRRGERQVPLAELATPAELLDPNRALSTQTLDMPRKALAGLTWTLESGWSLIAEGWWDGTAPTAADWRRLGDEARQRAALLGAPGVPALAVAGSIAASTQLFQVPSVSRRAALAHLGWSDPAGGKWSGALDVLRTLEDGGWSITASLGWQSDRVRCDAGLRRFGGSPDSAYRLLPEQTIAFAGASVAF